MANPDFPMGFIPLRKKGGGKVEYDYVTLSSTNAAIAPNDALIRTSAGVIDIATAASQNIVGVAAEAKAANTGGLIQIVPAKGHQFVCQADEADVAAVTNLNLNYDIVATASVSGQSKMELDSSTGATTASLPLKAIEKFDGFMPGGTDQYANDYGAQVKLVVEFNSTSEGLGSVGV